MMEEIRQTVHSDELNSIRSLSGESFKVKLKKFRNILTNVLTITKIAVTTMAKYVRAELLR